MCEKGKRICSRKQSAIADAYRRGDKVSKIISDYGISTATLYEILTRQCVKACRSKHGKPRKTPMVSPYLQHACDERRIGYVDIAEMINYSHEHTYIVLTGYKPMTPFFARALGENMQLDSDRIYQEATEWWQMHRGVNV